MKTENKLSFSIIRKIVFISLILIMMFGIGVIATNTELTNVTIEFSDKYQIEVVTSKVKVADILAENNIIVLEDEDVYPELEDNISITKKIRIYKKEQASEIISEEVESVATQEILGEYVTITEKIIVEQVEIPFETITKDVSNNSEEKLDKVLQQGENGIKEVKYRVKYQGDVEVERVEISSVVIKEPKNKIIQISTKVTSRSGDRSIAANAANALAARVANITPRVMNMNTSAYCACMKCCGKTNAITASGARATAWYTVAAGKGLPMGTVIYIPALSYAPNGGWFVVQDRGGAISNSKLDIYMNTHSAALSYGRKTLECYVYY